MTHQSDDSPLDVGITRPIRGRFNITVEEGKHYLNLSPGMRVEVYPVDLTPTPMQRELLVQPLATEEQLKALTTSLAEFKRVKHSDLDLSKPFIPEKPSPENEKFLRLIGIDWATTEQNDIPQSPTGCHWPQERCIQTTIPDPEKKEE